jgi:hypothetical protein
MGDRARHAMGQVLRELTHTHAAVLGRMVGHVTLPLVERLEAHLKVQQRRKTKASIDLVLRWWPFKVVCKRYLAAVWRLHEAEDAIDQCLLVARCAADPSLSLNKVRLPSNPTLFLPPLHG